MTPEEAQRVGYALVSLVDALGDRGRLSGITQTWRGLWYTDAVSDRLGRHRWPRVAIYSRARPLLSEALEDLAARIRDRESRRRT